MNKILLVLALVALVSVGASAAFGQQMVCGPNGCYFAGGGGYYQQPIVRAPMVQVYAPPRPMMRYAYGGYAQPVQQSYGSAGGYNAGGYGSSGGYAPAMQSYGSSGGVSGYYGW